MPISSPQLKRIATLAAPVATLAGPLFAIFGVFYFAVTTTATKAEVKEQNDELTEDVKKMLMMMATKAEVKELKAEVKELRVNVSEIRTMMATKAEVMEVRAEIRTMMMKMTTTEDVKNLMNALNTKR